MITDSLLKVADAQALPLDYDGGAVVSASSIDLQTARDIGEGENLYMLFSIDTAATTTTTTGTAKFQIITADAAALTGNVKVLDSTDDILYSTLAAGYFTALRIPPNIGSKGQRYLGVQVVGGSEDLTAGNYTAQIVKDIEDAKKKIYASGFSIK